MNVADWISGVRIPVGAVCAPVAGFKSAPTDQLAVAFQFPTTGSNDGRPWRVAKILKTFPV